MKRVLVVDDEAAIRNLLTEFLTAHGYEVTTAENGQVALAAVTAGARPHVVLLDIAMPIMGGIEALRRLRSLLPRCEVIMISGHADQDLALQALDLGAYDFIQKPLDIRYLERTLLAKIVTLDDSPADEGDTRGDDASARNSGRRSG